MVFPFAHARIMQSGCYQAGASGGHVIYLVEPLPAARNQQGGTLNWYRASSMVVCSLPRGRRRRGC